MRLCLCWRGSPRLTAAASPCPAPRPPLTADGFVLLLLLLGLALVRSQVVRHGEARPPPSAPEGRALLRNASGPRRRLPAGPSRPFLPRLTAWRRIAGRSQPRNAQSRGLPRRGALPSAPSSASRLAPPLTAPRSPRAAADPEALPGRLHAPAPGNRRGKAGGARGSGPERAPAAPPCCAGRTRGS